jgi:hypothetical protein
LGKAINSRKPLPNRLPLVTRASTERGSETRATRPFLAVVEAGCRRVRFFYSDALLKRIGTGETVLERRNGEAFYTYLREQTEVAHLQVG